jgi:hypothetical protein
MKLYLFLGNLYHKEKHVRASATFCKWFYRGSVSGDAWLPVKTKPTPFIVDDGSAFCIAPLSKASLMQLSHLRLDYLGKLYI